MAASPREFATENLLLRSLGRRALAKLAPLLQTVSLEAGQVLNEPGERIAWIYFPESCLVAKVAVTEEGQGVEVGVVGRKGMMGVCQFLGGDTTPFRTVVQIGGTARRLTTPAFRGLVEADRTLHATLTRYTLTLIQSISQTSACNFLHPLSRRLARWLLIASDAVAASELPLTHESLAHLLGVRRQSVTEVAREFAQRDLIRYRWGQITILDRPGLEAAACECYRLIRDYRSAQFAEGGSPPGS
jgi:CRP-like cAMP-binding protein